ncbi:hypothetical protein CcaverHIS002_0108900 [Cutaneotrichosporon cavernicola]|uniref:Uncharacterized protein n=1 Tax=Cutaneotrichosporon cavernicola TaxID=279322 RepID=A0AA48I5D4_9TREE|nr:uncharacterized protein CcaverHIS019_0108830 [Cutaneotrichosporon cavernicola]BEI80361.1 hypothetical protein CcaverHIS002_0108900 [Cutaneotrichosporon cavernicola]BEI88165.1 hypothetical protein CcaverHIS019_0108830 [Cutaneotrichosporon cavernicola]BEI95936.1 hypothetical protein CcaverHIS631_0108850 [Cutaneotrichosporon cavernicola]BEJ03711.1 hypothetical protein CcaverHIS641_0108860 [Cutaneotrichosporon cavernicola]
MSLVHITNTSFYESVDSATSVPQAHWPLYMATEDLEDGMRACIVYPNWLMAGCCENGSDKRKRSEDSSLSHDEGWDVCITTLSDKQLKKCFKKLAANSDDDDDDDDDNGNDWEDEESGNGKEGDGDDGSWKPNDKDEGGYDDGSWKPNGDGEDKYDDCMWHGKRIFRRANLVRRDAFEFSCVRPSGARPKFSHRVVFASSVFAAALTILAAGL